MQCNDEQTALALVVDRRQTGHRFGPQAARLDDAQAAGTLGDQPTTIWQEGDGPGVFESVEQCGHAEAMRFGTDYSGFYGRLRGG